MAKFTKGPKLLISKLRQIQRKVVRETAGETGKVVRSIDTQLRRRIWPAKNLSKQDDPRGIGQRLSSRKEAAYKVDWTAKSDGILIKLAASPHYTAARTPAIMAAFTRLGRAGELARASLLVRKGGRGKKVKGAPTVRIMFSRNPLLKVWADRRDKGEQARRHVVQIDRAVLLAVVMSPAIEKSRKAVLAAWRRGVENGFVG